jgi:hypothetical protein
VEAEAEVIILLIVQHQEQVELVVVEQEHIILQLQMVLPIQEVVEEELWNCNHLLLLVEMVEKELLY